jgi:DNA replicative helicase MCM subunit Mcm2 (Cdc46/Mcm family)
MTSNSKSNIGERDLKDYVQPFSDSSASQGITYLDPDPAVEEIIHRCYIRKNRILIDLKNPNADKVVATIRDDYTAFRSGLKNLLKEKGVDEEGRRKVINFVDINHEIIYRDPSTKDNYPDGKDAKADLSDQPECNETKKLTISECIKLDSGKVQVIGDIVAISEPFKAIHEFIQNCDCQDVPKTYTYDPPLLRLPKDYNGKCSKCDEEQSISYKNAITIQLQDSEKTNDIEKLTCILLEVGIDKIRVGERVSITGDVHVQPKNVRRLLTPMVFADRIDYENKEKITLSQNDIAALKRFATVNGSSTTKAWVDMFDKSIVGNHIAKEALLYALVSAGDDTAEIRTYKRRSRINVLLAGDPGQAKSSLLKRVASLIPNSRYESTQHSSSKSLTAIVSKEDEQYSLRLGPIPIARGSVCGLNEIGTMVPEEQNHLLDIMEEGEFTINKHGINSKIKSPTVIVASTNLHTNTSEQLCQNDDKISLSQIPLERQLLDRFDLIVVLKENGDIEALKEYTKEKSYLLSRKVPNYESLLQKLIEYARTLKPAISPEAKDMIGRYYIDLNKSNRGLKSKRILETLYRLSMAVAKLKLKEIVEAEDAEHATKFYNILINNYLFSLPIIPRDPRNVAVKQCVYILKEGGENPVLFIDLIKRVSGEDSYIKSYLLGSQSEKIDEFNLSLEKNKKVRIIKDLLCSDESVLVVNKTPLKLQYKQKDSHIPPLSPPEGSERSDLVQTMAATGGRSDIEFSKQN